MATEFNQEEWRSRMETRIMLHLMALIEQHGKIVDPGNHTNNPGLSIDMICSVGCQGVKLEENEQGFVITFDNEEQCVVIVRKLE